MRKLVRPDAVAVLDDELAKKTVDFYKGKLKWLEDMSITTFKNKKAKNQA